MATRFPQDRLTYSIASAGGSPALLSGANAVLTVYADEAGTVPAGIVDEAGAPISNSRIVVDSESMLPYFFDPQSRTRLWVKAVGATRTYPVDAVVSGEIAVDVGKALERIGALAALETTQKTDLVGAINEVLTQVGLQEVSWANVQDKPTISTAPVGNAIVQRTPEGAVAVGAPTAGSHAVTRDYVLTSAAPVPGVPITNFVLPGEVLDPTNSTSISPILQRAVDNVSVAFGPVQILMPAGDFYSPVAITPRSKVGLRGAGVDLTRFHTGTGNCFILGNMVEPWDGTFLDDLNFTDFTVDCSNQQWGSYNGALKAFYAQNIRHSKWERVNAIGSWASMYGVDFLVDCTFIDCVGIGSGRGVPPSPAGTGSTFAFGVGRHDNESITLINCRAVDAAAGGFFFERLEDRGATKTDGVFRIIGGSAQNCGIGVVDCGAGAILAPDIKIDGSLYVGWFIGPGGQSSIGGINGFIGGVIRGTKAGLSENGVGGGHGVQIKGGPAAGGYVISARIEGNLGSPIYGSAGHSISDGGLTIHNSRLDGAIVMRSSTTDTRGLTIVDNHITLSAGGPAIDITTSLIAPRISGNTVKGADSLLRIDPSRPPVDPVIRDNTAPGASALAAGGTVSGLRVGSNALSVTPPGTIYYDSLKSVAGTVNGLGDGWSATAGTGLTALGWVRTPNGARPDGSAHCAQHRDIGTVPGGVRVSAILEASTATPRRRGIQISVNPTSGIAVIAEAEAGAGGFYRLIRQGSTGTRTTLWTSTIPSAQSHEVGLSRPEGSTLTTMWIDGVAVQTIDIPQIPATTYVGVVGYSGALSKISDFTVSPLTVTPVVVDPEQVDWVDIKNKPTLSTVATSGSYADLTNKPSIPTTLPPTAGSVTQASMATGLVAMTTAERTTLGGLGEQYPILAGNMNNLGLRVTDLEAGATSIERYVGGLHVPEPTVTAVQEYDTTISGGVLVPALVSMTTALQGANLDVDVLTEDVFTFLGAGGLENGASWPDTQFVLPTSLYPNQYGVSAPSVWSVAFGYDGDEFEVRYKYMGSHARIRVWIDGQPVSPRMVPIGGQTAGYEHVFNVDLGSRASRTIQIDLGDVPFGGVWRQPDATMWRLPQPKERAILIGDSHAGGSSENSHGYTWPSLAAERLGIRDMWNNAIGGSGYTVNGQGTTYINRVEGDVTAWSPSMVILQGGYNDGSQTLSTVLTAATALYSKVKSDLPTADVYVVGPFSPTATPDQIAIDLDAGLRARALSSGLPYISMLSGDIVDGEGVVVLDGSPWITTGNHAAYIGSDNVHPNDAGHEYIALRFTQAIQALQKPKTNSGVLVLPDDGSNIPSGTPIGTLIARV